MQDFVSQLLTSVSALAAAGGVAALMPRVSRRILPPVRRDRLRDHLGFERVLTQDYIRTVDGTLIATIEVEGQDISAKPDEEQDKLWIDQKSWLNEMGQFPGTVRVFSRKVRLDKSLDTTVYTQEWQRAMMETWLGGFAEAYGIHHTIVLSIRGGKERAREHLDAAVNETMTSLREFGAKVLPLGKSGRESPLLTFWAQALNPGAPVVVHPTRGAPVEQGRVTGALDRRLIDHLIGTEVLFHDGRDHRQDDGLIRFKRGQTDVWACVIGVTTWSIETSPDIVAEVLSADAEIVALQTMRVFDKDAAIPILESLKRNAGMSGRALEQIGDIEQMLDHKGAAPMAQRLVRIQLSIFVYGDSREDLKRKAEEVQGRLQDNACKSVVDTWCAEPAWFAQFPPHGDMEGSVGSVVLGGDDHARPMLMMTGNVAHLASLETPPQGRDSCIWGDRPVTYLRTTTGAPYGFTWHKPGSSATDKTVGNAMMFGGMGAGKTVAMNFLCVASMGYPNTYCFMTDRRDGAYVPTKAFGGRYVHLNTDVAAIGDVAELAPLQMDYTADDHGSLSGHGKWLLGWIRDFLVRASSEDTVGEKEIEAALAQLSRSPREDRSFDQLLHGISHNSRTRQMLMRWSNQGTYRRAFNGSRDTLQFDDEHRWVTLDFTRALSDSTLIGALIPYLAYRIESAMVERNANWILALDEAAAMIADPAVAKWYMELNQEIRKVLGIIISNFQRVSSIKDVSEAQREALMTNTPTIMCFPNNEASADDYIGLLGLTPTEFDIVRGANRFTREKKHWLLLKKKGEGSIVLEIDLGPLSASPHGDLLQFLNSGPDVAAIYRQCEAEFGERGAAHAYLSRMTGGRVRAVGTVGNKELVG